MYTSIHAAAHAFACMVVCMDGCMYFRMREWLGAFSHAWMTECMYHYMHSCVYTQGQNQSFHDSTMAIKFPILTLSTHATIHLVIHTCSHPCMQKCTQPSTNAKIHTATHACNHAHKCVPIWPREWMCRYVNQASIY